MIGGLPVVRSTGQTLSEAGRYLRRACTCTRCRQSKADGGSPYREPQVELWTNEGVKVMHRRVFVSEEIRRTKDYLGRELW